MPARALQRLALAVVAVLCAVGVWWLYATFVATAPGQRLDERLSGRLLDRGNEATDVLDTVSVGSLVLALVAAVVIALLRRRPGLALAAVTIVVGSNVTTQLLKHGLDRPYLGQGTNNSLPSGHATVAASVAAALTVVMVPWLRPYVAVLGVLVAGWMGGATVVSGWHRVSDVAAAYLVVLFWTAVALLAVSTGRRRTPAGTPASERSAEAVGPAEPR